MKKSLLLYLYSNRNIVGSVLGLLGMGLYFAGLLGALWLPIVVGLYAAGALGTPASRSWDLRASLQYEGERLREALVDLQRSVRKKLGAEQEAQLAQLTEGLVYLLDKSATTDFGPHIEHFLRQTVQDYLPVALDRYLNLPPAYRRFHQGRDGKTAQKLLEEQLGLLNAEVTKVIGDIHQNDLRQIEAHRVFLEEKFKREQWLS